MGTLIHWGDMENWFGEEVAKGVGQVDVEVGGETPTAPTRGLPGTIRPAISDNGGVDSWS